MIIGVRTAWAVRCNTCQYGRFFEERERDAAKAISRHKAEHPNHTIRLFRNGKVVQRLSGSEGTLPLPMGFGIDDDGSTIPF